ncbi:MAG TPA: DUF4399 domain-containing protein [Chitinophagaceae bacterium]|nr:DUF4399 domain-containing protein [Chitinophagaceae bacterium]
MIKKIFYSAVCLGMLAACNNSGKEDEKKSDSSSTMSSDTSHSMTMNTTEVPALPAIPKGAKVFFKSPKNGATVTSPFKVEMGTEVIKVDTAGPVVAGSGHHHLFIDAEDSLMAGTMVPKDSMHLHFGKGQMETELKLSPGKHKLTLQFADGLHRSYGSKLSSTITVNVKK